MTAAPEPEFTATQVIDGIRAALAEKNLKVIPGLITYLATIDPQSAQEVYDTLLLGTHMAAGGDVRVRLEAAP